MELQEKKKGCVYFFRHVGLKPIKIGFSSNVSPLKRFNQFKTYAPFGAEIIGFIQTDEAKEIEKLLHIKFSNKRLDGEWFDISEKECLSEIDFYTSKEDIKERNNFQIAWAKKLIIEKESYIAKSDNNLLSTLSYKEKFEYFKKQYNKNNTINKKEYSKILNVSRRSIYNWLKKIENDR